MMPVLQAWELLERFDAGLARFQVGHHLGWWRCEQTVYRQRTGG
jgi:hypothetical protein